jgi:hypothetical protein
MLVISVVSEPVRLVWGDLLDLLRGVLYRIQSLFV